MLFSLFFAIQLTSVAPEVNFEPHSVLRRTWTEDKHLLGTYCRATLIAPNTFMTYRDCIKSEHECGESKTILWSEEDGKIDAFASRKAFDCHKIIFSDDASSFVIFESKENTLDLSEAVVSNGEASVLGEMVKAVRHDRLTGQVTTVACQIETKVEKGSIQFVKEVYQTSCALDANDRGLGLFNSDNEMIAMVVALPAKDDKHSYAVALDSKAKKKIAELSKSEEKKD